MKYFFLAGRIIFALPFLVFGINHFIYAGTMGVYVPSFIPGGVFWIYLTGLSFIAASISIIINKLINISALLLAIELLIFILTMHIPGLFKEGQTQMAMIGLCKDFAMMGGSLFIWAYYKDKK